MADITITINDAHVSRVLDAFESRFGYQSTIPDGNGDPIPNPESRQAFSKRMLIGQIHDMVKREEAKAAADTAAGANPADIT